MKVLCENYEKCDLFNEENCPHMKPHDKYEMCDLPCTLDKYNFICREIILKD